MKTNNLIKKWSKDLNRHITKANIHTVSKHTKRCFKLYVITELQIKQDTTIRLLEWFGFETLATPNAGVGVEKQAPSLIDGEDSERCRLFGRQFGNFLQN